MNYLKRYRKKQELAAPSRYYGDGGTIHSTSVLDVETDESGGVVSVWFRCQRLPFHEVIVDGRRAQEMLSSAGNEPLITGVEVLDR